MSKVYKRIKLSKITGYVTFAGHNHRNPFQSLGTDEVLFRGELIPQIEALEAPVEGSENPPDLRTVLTELVVSPEANEETRKNYLTRFRTSEPDIWAMAHTMMDPSVGQLEPIKVVVTADGFGLFDGARRFMAKMLAYCISPDTVDDEIDAVVFPDTEEASLDTKAVVSNIQRKAVSEVEIGKIAASMKKNGLSYKEIAKNLNIYTGAKGNKVPEPNHQYVRQVSLLWSDKVTDADREAIVKGEKGYTKVLQNRGLLPTSSPTAGVEASDEGKTKVRKRAKNLRELTEIFDDVSACTKILETFQEKGIVDPTEQVRFILMKAANARYKPFPAPEVKEEEAA